MDVRRLLSVSVATLVVLGALMLGMARESAALPLMVLAAAVAAFWLTDFAGRFRLGVRAVNLAVVGAAAITAGRLARYRAVDLMVAADALLWVEIVLLFEEKSARTWWDLISLSLLSVCMAALTSQGPLFGLMLVAYLFFGLSALSLLLVVREQAAWVPRADKLPVPPGRTDWRRLVKIALLTPVMGPLSLFLRFGEADGDARHVDHPGTAAGGTTAGFGPAPEIGGELWGWVTGTSLASLLVALVVFCAVPRVGRVDRLIPRLRRAWNNEELSPRRSVGFSDQVALGELGTIIENPEEVLQVRFVDATGGRYPVRGEVYLRGAVLTRYEAGQWEYRAAGGRVAVGRLGPGNPPPDGELVRQQITIEPMDRQELFCVWPFVFLGQDDALGFDAEKERLFRRPADLRAQRFSFELGTTAFADGVQVELVPCQGDVDPRVLLQWPSASLPGLAELAERWIAESGIPADDVLGRARLLEERLRDPDRFEYTLEGQVRDAALDPIEDFVVNHPRGHCEYFATALALMLRSQGIPARLVVGYKCDEYGYLSQAYRVRQSHAHAWVEAYVAPERLSPGLAETRRFMDWSNGGWLRLDATPAGSGGAGAGLVVRVEDWLEWVRAVWSRDVLGMSRSRQDELFFRPLVEWIKEVAHHLADPGWWREVARSVGRGLLALPGAVLNGRGSGWRLAILVAAVLCGLVLLWYGFRGLAERLGIWLPGLRRARRGGRGPKIAFYRRLETLLARFGLTRPASQTQREFARDAGARIAESTGERQLVDLPIEITEAFYRVRFGGRILDRREALAVNEALSRLERLKRRRWPGSPPPAGR